MPEGEKLTRSESEGGRREAKIRLLAAPEPRVLTGIPKQPYRAGPSGHQTALLPHAGVRTYGVGQALLLGVRRAASVLAHPPAHWRAGVVVGEASRLPSEVADVDGGDGSGVISPNYEPENHLRDIGALSSDKTVVGRHALTTSG